MDKSYPKHDENFENSIPQGKEYLSTPDYDAELKEILAYIEKKAHAQKMKREGKKIKQELTGKRGWTREEIYKVFPFLAEVDRQNAKRQANKITSMEETKAGTARAKNENLKDINLPIEEFAEKYNQSGEELSADEVTLYLYAEDIIDKFIKPGKDNNNLAKTIQAKIKGLNLTLIQQIIFEKRKAHILTTQHNQRINPPTKKPTRNIVNLPNGGQSILW